MNRVAWTAAAVAVVLAVAAAGLWWLTGASAPPQTVGAVRPGSLPPRADPLALTAESPVIGSGLRTLEVTLFFARSDARGLAPETRSIFETAGVLDRMKQTVVALIGGPADDSLLLPVLPAGTSLLDIFLDADGTAYVDFGRELTRRLQPGVASELLATGALTHTLVHNFPGVRQVRILIMGDEIPTLGGHLDLQGPLRADPSLVVPLEPEGEEGEDTPTDEEAADDATRRAEV